MLSMSSNPNNKGKKQHKVGIYLELKALLLLLLFVVVVVHAYYGKYSIAWLNSSISIHSWNVGLDITSNAIFKDYIYWINFLFG
jgi:hypothetical protein